MIINIKNTKKKGFTLIELVVIIGIIAILSAIAVPRYTHYIEDSKKASLKKGAERIYSACLLAESTLVSQGNTSPSSQQLVTEANKILIDEVSLTLADDDTRYETYKLASYIPITSTNNSKFTFTNNYGESTLYTKSYPDE